MTDIAREEPTNKLWLSEGAAARFEEIQHNTEKVAVLVSNLEQRIIELEKVNAWQAEQLAKAAIKREPTRDDPEEDLNVA